MISNVISNAHAHTAHFTTNNACLHSRIRDLKHACIHRQLQQRRHVSQRVVDTPELGQGVREVVCAVGPHAWVQRLAVAEGTQSDTARGWGR